VLNLPSLLVFAAAATANGRVQWLAFAEAALAVGLSMFQLKYIRTWFKDTEKLGRV